MKIVVALKSTNHLLPLIFFVFRVRQYISRFRHFHFQSIFRFWRNFCRSWVHWRLEDPRNGSCKSHWPPFEISNKERIVRRSRKKPQRHTQEKRRGDRKSCIRLFCWILLCTFHDYVLLDFFSSLPTLAADLQLSPPLHTTPSFWHISGSAPGE